MSMQNHILELEKRHKAMDREIALQTAQPGASDLKLAELKRKKLHLKEEIEKFRAAQEPGQVH